MNYFLKKELKKFDLDQVDKAILQNKVNLLKAQNSPELEKRNAWDFSSIHFAKYLRRKEILNTLKYSEKITIKMQEKDEVFTLRAEEFEKKMGIEYLPWLCFDKWENFKKVLIKCKKAKEKEFFSSHQNWLGFYYSKEIMSGFVPDFLVIRWINTKKGYGIFTSKDLKKNQYLGEYTGVVRKRTPRKDWKNAYCFEYLICEKWSTNLTIDAKDQGNITRFINHSFTPNVKPMTVFSRGVMHVLLFTSQSIAKGSELCYDYGMDYWKKREDPI